MLCRVESCLVELCRVESCRVGQISPDASKDHKDSDGQRVPEEGLMVFFNRFEQDTGY